MPMKGWVSLNCQSSTDRNSLKITESHGSHHFFVNFDQLRWKHSLFYILHAYHFLVIYSYIPTQTNIRICLRENEFLLLFIRTYSNFGRSPPQFKCIAVRLEQFESQKYPQKSRHIFDNIFPINGTQPIVIRITCTTSAVSFPSSAWNSHMPPATSGNDAATLK